MPEPSDQRGSPSRTTAAESPGTLFAAMKLATAFSMASRFSCGRFFCSTGSAAAQERVNKEKKTAYIAQRFFPGRGRRIRTDHLARESIATREGSKPLTT